LATEDDEGNTVAHSILHGGDDVGSSRAKRQREGRKRAAKSASKTGRAIPSAGSSGKDALENDSEAKEEALTQK
jgi:hypothetical protein